MSNTTIVHVPLSAGDLQVSSDRAEELIALKPACETIGVDFPRQLKKLKLKEWATVAFKATVGADGRIREMAMVTRETFTMWLATLESSRVSESARPTLIAFQKEAAKALDSYFHEGQAINPRSIDSDLVGASKLAAAQARALNALKSMLPAGFVEAKAKILAARVLGEAAEVAPIDMPIYAEAYLLGRGLPREVAKAKRSAFGQRVSNLYLATHGVRPKKSAGEVNHRLVQIAGYTGKDLPLLDQVFDAMGLAELVPAGPGDSPMIFALDPVS